MRMRMSNMETGPADPVDLFQSKFFFWEIVDGD